MSKLSKRWICESHSFETLSRWVSSLELFRFVRAWGGHANDGDQFVLLISYNDFTELISILNLLDIEVNIIPDDYPRPEVGISYSWEEYRVFKQEVKAYPGYEQPGKVPLLNREVYLYIKEGLIEIHVMNSDNPYVVTESDFQYCLELEKFLQSKFDFNYSFERDVRSTYITEKLYPEFIIND